MSVRARVRGARRAQRAPCGTRATAHVQLSLARALPAMLANLGVDDLHVGVITSDLGTTGAPPVGVVGQGGCADTGRDGAFVLRPDLVDGPFVIHGAAKNYTGELPAALASLIAVGDDGCGFEQPLAATQRALARDTGFVRDDAALAVIVVADEDDCSIADPSILEQATDRFGQLQSFRCTRYGVVCNESLDELGEKTGCEPWHESPYLVDPRRISSALDDVKPRREHLAVGAIVGPPSPVAVERRTINNLEQPALGRSCEWARPTSMTAIADPAVRIASFVEDFGSRGALTSVCNDDLSSTLATIGLAIKWALGTACIDTSLLADGSAAEGVQPACEVIDVLPGEPPQASALPRCPADGDCYDLVADPAACPETADHARIAITRAAPPAAGTRVEVRCEAPVR